VQFQRLRLSGFKSFVEPTELLIEPGLTGVVGPNGCGKSNLLEALRWVMGANSAKAMRAGGMDDVIFSGSGRRPGRNHAEVQLTVDNADRSAPEPFRDHPILEVTRRIDRGAGSTYRLNGKEVRAKDVHLLFADASTGANSPALVRQGQISELIAAKPQNRRRVLEEAAGVAGLHARRHEAELRLRAAEANLDRLDDVVRELETALNRLRRESRQAGAYKRLAAEIRSLQSAVLHARWRDARNGLDAAEAERSGAALSVEIAAREAASASTRALDAEAALPPLREEAAVASALLQRAAIENDRVTRDEAQARAEFDRLSGALRHLAADAARETQVVEDSAEVLARLDSEVAALEAAVASAPERLPELEAALVDAEAERSRTEAEVERLASDLAVQRARREAAQRARAEAQARLDRLDAALQAARTERAGLADTPPEEQTARTRHASAAEALQAAREAAEAAEADRGDAARAEPLARDAARKLDDQLGRARAEARGLAQLLAPSSRAYPPALDQVTPERGYEAALAAALGDDLDAAIDPAAPSHWAGAEPRPPAWPEDVEPLAPRVDAPAELAARLAFVGLVDRARGEALAAGLPVGARLVSREGDLWRWDGFVSRAEAPRPAAVRLSQKGRLSELEAEIEALEPQARAAHETQRTAAERLRGAELAVKTTRSAAAEAERAVQLAREGLDRVEREAARRDARRQALDESIERLDAERAEAAPPPPAAEDASTSALETELQQARAAASARREASASARAALDGERRERQARAARLDDLRRQGDDWRRRARDADARLGDLAARRTRLEASIKEAREAPEKLAAKRADITDQLAAAEVRRARATDALAEAESARSAAERAAREADRAAASAGEARAAADARLEAAQARLNEAAEQVRESLGVEPHELEPHASGLDGNGVDARLKSLERERDAIGPVNLRAEEEAVEQAERLAGLQKERADLSGAIARLRSGIESLNDEGRERLAAAFDVIHANFQTLFATLFEGGQAELKLIESDDPLEAGLEIYACPPGKRLAAMSLLSGGEQALTAAALIFAVFLSNPAPICVLDEVDAPLDDANVDRFCRMLDELRRRTQTRFLVITHNAVTMSRMDRLYGVTMAERGVSQLVSVDLRQAEAIAAE
jgi:chromosome segregation protein